MWGNFAFLMEAFWGWVFDILVDVGTFVRDGTVFIIQWLFDQVAPLFPESVRAIMSTDMLKRVLAFFDMIDGLIPVTEMFTIWVAGLTAVLSIRVGRWLFACIPTLGG